MGVPGVERAPKENPSLKTVTNWANFFMNICSKPVGQPPKFSQLARRCHGLRSQS